MIPQNLKNTATSCPKCNLRLERVPQSPYLNSDQWDAVKAGDWFCRWCPTQTGTGNAGIGHSYFTNKTLADIAAAKRTTIESDGWITIWPLAVTA